LQGPFILTLPRAFRVTKKEHRRSATARRTQRTRRAPVAGASTTPASFLPD
jgi:hypothetical protein